MRRFAHVTVKFAGNDEMAKVRDSTDGNGTGFACTVPLPRRPTCLKDEQQVTMQEVYDLFPQYYRDRRLLILIRDVIECYFDLFYDEAQEGDEHEEFFEAYGHAMDPESFDGRKVSAFRSYVFDVLKDALRAEDDAAVEAAMPEALRRVH